MTPRSGDRLADAIFMPNARSRTGWVKVALLVTGVPRLLLWFQKGFPASPEAWARDIVFAGQLFLLVLALLLVLDLFVAAGCRRSLARLRAQAADPSRKPVLVRVRPQTLAQAIVFGRLMGRDIRDAVDGAGRRFPVESRHEPDREFEAELFDVRAPWPWRLHAPWWAAVPEED